jgi:hypothetical protein
LNKQDVQSMSVDDLDSIFNNDSHSTTFREPLRRGTRKPLPFSFVTSL